MFIGLGEKPVKSNKHTSARRKVWGCDYRLLFDVALGLSSLILGLGLSLASSLSLKVAAPAPKLLAVGLVLVVEADGFLRIPRRLSVGYSHRRERR